MLGSYDGIQSPAASAVITYSGNRKIEKQLQATSRVRGAVSVCFAGGHPFFEEGKGCLLCGGVRQELNDEVFREAGEHLYEESFLAAMRAL